MNGSGVCIDEKLVEVSGLGLRQKPCSLGHFCALGLRVSGSGSKLQRGWSVLEASRVQARLSVEHYLPGPFFHH